MMVGSFANFPRFSEQSFENLNPGWIELADICFPVQCNDGTLAENAPLRKWYISFETLRPIVNWLTKQVIAHFEGGAKAGRGGDTALYYKQQLTDAGFTNISQTVYKWPQNRSPKDKHFVGWYTKSPNR